MAYIKTTLSQPHLVQLPTWFITDYMPKAPNGYAQVYLYLYTLTATRSDNDFSLEDVSSALGMLYLEVVQALKYWHEKKVVIFNELENEAFELSFPIEPPVKPEVTTNRPISKMIINQTRPEYGIEEMNFYLKDPEVRQLFKVAEQYLGGLLTITDQKILYSLYDWLHMPFDLIEFLIEYCVSNNHKSTRYIEKVAISWVDQGITTVAAAKAKVVDDKRYFQILNSLGTSKPTLTQVEKERMSKWLNTYRFSMDIILEACKRTVMQTSNPSLNYVDSILTSWHNDKVKTLQDVASLDKAFESKNMQAASGVQKNNTSNNKIAKFNSMYSHDWDFDALEQLQEEHIKRKLNGGN